MQAYSNPKRANDPYALPDIEIFEVFDDGDGGYVNAFITEDGYRSEEGFYWQSCFPGCLPDSDPIGPFATQAEALADAQEGCEDDDDVE